MANAVNTGSTLTTTGGQNKTSTSLSTNVIIMVNGTAVGAIQELSVNEQGNVQMIDEVGTDGPVDSVRNSSVKITGTCRRIRFDRMRITEAFSRGFLHVASQAYPFDIVILDRQKSDAGNQISTVIKNVWISSLGYSYGSQDYIITDTMGWSAEHIFSILNNGSGNPAAQGGERGLAFSNIPIERETDTGRNGRRGSLDASGLIDLARDFDVF